MVITMMHIPQISVINAHYGLHLTWDPSASSDISHYSVHMSRHSTTRNYQHMGDSPVASFSIPSFNEPGLYYFIVYAHDKNGNTSIASEEVSFTVM